MASFDSTDFIGTDGSSDSGSSFEFIISRPRGSGDASETVSMTRHSLASRRNNLNISRNDAETELSLTANQLECTKIWRSFVAMEMGLIAADIVAITNKAAEYVHSMKDGKSSKI